MTYCCEAMLRCYTNEALPCLLTFHCPLYLTGMSYSTSSCFSDCTFIHSTSFHPCSFCVPSHHLLSSSFFLHLPPSSLSSLSLIPLSPLLPSRYGPWPMWTEMVLSLVTSSPLPCTSSSVAVAANQSHPPSPLRSRPPHPLSHHPCTDHRQRYSQGRHCT